jgi:hypothetical protein
MTANCILFIEAVANYFLCIGTPDLRKLKLAHINFWP